MDVAGAPPAPAAARVTRANTKRCRKSSKRAMPPKTPTSPKTEARELGIVCDNHRLAVARTKGETDIPIIFHNKDATAVSALFPNRVSVPDARECQFDGSTLGGSRSSVSVP